MRGWVTITASTDEPERRFAVGAVVMADRPREVLEARYVPRLAVLFEGCTDRNDAEALRGTWLYADVTDTPDDPDEYYDHQLEGLTVVVNGRQIGVVREVLHLPAQDVLDVEIDGRHRLIPFVEQLVPLIDLQAGQVHVVDMEGLLDDAD